jgi:hypothetical protein
MNLPISPIFVRVRVYDFICSVQELRSPGPGLLFFLLAGDHPEDQQSASSEPGVELGDRCCRENTVSKTAENDIFGSVHSESVVGCQR